MSKLDTFVACKNVVGPVYDVWWGKGWDNWSRVKIEGKNSSVEHIKGIKMPFHIRSSVIKYLRLE